MLFNRWIPLKGILKQYIGILVQDDLLIEEGFDQETKRLDEKSNQSKEIQKNKSL